MKHRHKIIKLSENVSLENLNNNPLKIELHLFNTAQSSH